jgi:hypothetical protein
MRNDAIHVLWLTMQNQTASVIQSAGVGEVPAKKTKKGAKPQGSAKGKKKKLARYNIGMESELLILLVTLGANLTRLDFDPDIHIENCHIGTSAAMEVHGALLFSIHSCFYTDKPCSH